MPYKAYYTNPGFGQGVENLSSALFPDPRRQQADRLNLLRQRELEQKINVGRRDAGAQDDLFNAMNAWNSPDADPTQAMALYGAYGGGASGLPTMVEGYAAQQFATGNAGDDARRWDLSMAMGNSMGPNSAVSLGDRDAVAGRNAGYEMDQAMATERMRQAGQTARAGAPGQAEATAAMQNHQFRVQQRLRNNPGMTEQQAWALELGDRNDRMDDLGNLSIVDRGQGTAERIQIDGMDPPLYAVPPSPGREDLSFDPGAATGVVASAQGVWNNTVAQAIPNWTAMGPEQAAQQTDIMRLNLMSALRSTNRPLAIEMELVNSLLPGTMAWLQNPEVARQQTLQVLDLAGQQYLADMQVANDPGRSRQERSEHGARAAQVLRAMQTGLSPEAVDRYTSTAGAPATPRRASPGAQSMMQGPQDQQGMPTWEQYDTLPSGAEFTDPDGNVRVKP